MRKYIFEFQTEAKPEFFFELWVTTAFLKNIESKVLSQLMIKHFLYIRSELV